MSAAGGNPHLEGIISDFEGLESFDAFFNETVYDKQLEHLDSVNTGVYVHDSPPLSAFCLKGCMCVACYSEHATAGLLSLILLQLHPKGSP